MCKSCWGSGFLGLLFLGFFLGGGVRFFVSAQSYLIFCCWWWWVGFFSFCYTDNLCLV